MTRRILFVAGTLDVGGAERQLGYMASALGHRGHHVEVVSLEGGVFAERLRALGAEVTILDGPSGPLHRLRDLTQHVRRVRPDVIQASHGWVSAYVAILGRALRIPAIGALRGDPNLWLSAQGRLAQVALRLPRIIVANSKSSIEEAVKLGVPPERLRHLPNAIDAERFAPAPNRADGPPRVLAVGRFVEFKRLDRYLRVIADLAARHDGHLEATLVGAGPLEPDLRSQAHDLGLDDVLRFVQTDDPLPHYHDADLLLFTSTAGDGMPNVVLEAMACAVPVVGFSSGDAREVIIDDVTGHLIEPNGDVDRMADAAARLLSDEPTRRRLGQGARAHVMAEHSIDAVGARLERIHSELLTPRQPEPA